MTILSLKYALVNEKHKVPNKLVNLIRQVLLFQKPQEYLVFIFATILLKHLREDWEHLEYFPQL